MMAVEQVDAPAAHNTVAVIVTFQPETDVVRHAEALVGQVVGIVVVDNGSGPGGTTILNSLSALPSVHVIRNPVNEGIAHALNQGAQAALDAGADWLLTLDQDAAPGPEIVRIAGHATGAYPWRSRIAVIGSASRSDLARSSGQANRGRPWIETSTVITAGSFVSLAAFRAVGGFREDLFIDYVDIEFCLRARASGYRVLASRAPTIRHQIGQPTVRSIGRRAVTPTNHPAFRRYYITRNRFLVWRLYGRTEPRYVLADILASQKELLKVLLFEEDRKSKVRAMLAGLRDGLRGSTARSSWPRRPL
jgi:rhamnosyltransferase